MGVLAGFTDCKCDFDSHDVEKSRLLCALRSDDGCRWSSGGCFRDECAEGGSSLCGLTAYCVDTDLSPCANGTVCVSKTVQATKTPTKLPSKSPQASPTGTPIAPSKSPVLPPSASPSKSPIAAPTKSPVRSPTFSTVAPGAHTKSPVVPPTKSPVTPPTSSPVAQGAPTKSPALPIASGSLTFTEPPRGETAKVSSPTITDAALSSITTFTQGIPLEPRQVDTDVPSAPPTTTDSVLAIRWGSPSAGDLSRGPQLLAELILGWPGFSRSAGGAARVEGGGRVVSPQQPVVFHGSIPPTAHPWGDGYEGVAAYAAAGGTFHATVSSDGRSMRVYGGGPPFRLRAPHSEEISVELRGSAFVSEDATHAVCQANFSCFQKLGQIRGVAPVGIPEGDASVIDAGQRSTMVAAAVSLAAGSGSGAAGGASRIGIVAASLGCPESRDDPEPLDPSLNPLQLSLGDEDEPARHAQGAVTGNSIIVAVSVVACLFGLVVRRRKYNNLTREADARGVEVRRWGAWDWAAHARADSIFVVCYFLYGGLVTGGLTVIAEGRRHSYTILAFAALVLVVVMCSVSLKAARGATQHSRWREMTLSERPHGLSWLLFGDSEWVPRRRASHAYVLLHLSQHVIGCVKGRGVRLYTTPLELLYTLILAVIAQSSPSSINGCVIQACSQGVVALMWAFYVAFWRPFISPFDNYSQTAIATAEGVALLLLVAGLSTGPNSFGAMGVTPACGWIVNWA
eukprot:Hpha_TRINITY_DN16552_c2_g4::TRINITY_DN16552_c2_g4_i4::g.132564::m.132564